MHCFSVVYCFADVLLAALARKLADFQPHWARSQVGLACGWLGGLLFIPVDWLRAFHRKVDPSIFKQHRGFSSLFSSLHPSLRIFSLQPPKLSNQSTNMSGKGGKAAAAGDAAKGQQSRSSKAGLQFPVGRIHRMLRKGNYAQRIGAGAPGEPDINTSRMIIPSS